MASKNRSLEPVPQDALAKKIWLENNGTDYESNPFDGLVEAVATWGNLPRPVAPDPRTDEPPLVQRTRQNTRADGWPPAFEIPTAPVPAWLHPMPGETLAQWAVRWRDVLRTRRAMRVRREAAAAAAEVADEAQRTAAADAAWRAAQVRAQTTINTLTFNINGFDMPIITGPPADTL